MPNLIRERNLINELSYLELLDGVMFTQNGHSCIGVCPQISSSTFLGDYSNLLRTYKHILNIMPEGSRLRIVNEVRRVDENFLSDYQQGLSAAEPALRKLHHDRVKLFLDDWQKETVL